MNKVEILSRALEDLFMAMEGFSYLIESPDSPELECYTDAVNLVIKTKRLIEDES